MLKVFTVVIFMRRVQRRLKRYLLYPKIMGAMTAIVLIGGYLIYYVERGHSPYFHSWWDGIWFAIITSSTVGYGDKYPVTVPGQIITILLIIIGGSLLAVLLANIGGTFALRMSRRERGLLPAHFMKNHIVICHWSRQARAAIQDYYEAHRSINFVLIDNYLQENPMAEYDAHFVRGDFTEDEILLRANVQHARAVLIFGDKRIDESTADAKAMKGVLAVKHLNPSVHTIVECLSGDVKSLYRVGADEVLNTGEINGRLLVQSTLSVGISQVLNELLVHDSGNYFYESRVPEKFAGRTFEEIAIELRRLGMNLIALGGGQETLLNPAPETIVRANHTLIYIGKNKFKRG